MTHVLVTGGTGALGCQVVELLLQKDKGYAVRVMSRRDGPVSNGRTAPSAPSNMGNSYG